MTDQNISDVMPEAPWICKTCGGTGGHFLGCSMPPDDVLQAEVERLREALTRAEGTLTLWLNLSPVEVGTIRPGPNGKTLAELTRETFDLTAEENR